MRRGIRNIASVLLIAPEAWRFSDGDRVIYHPFTGIEISLIGDTIVRVRGNNIDTSISEDIMLKRIVTKIRAKRVDNNRDKEFEMIDEWFKSGMPH